MRPGDIVKALTEAIASAVERQMMSDVPLGTMMSGGVDSSLVSAIASRHLPRIDTFTIGFHEKDYDETEQTKYLGRLLNLKTHNIYVDDKSFFENLEQCIWIHDEPLAHANSVMIYLLCQYARQYVKVLLTGEGADEFFGGYPRYYAYFIAGKLRGAGPVGKFLVGSAKSIFRDHRFGKIRDAMNFTPEEGAIWNASFVSPEKVSWLFDGIPEGIGYRRAEVYRSVSPCGSGRMERLLKFDQNSYLLPILARQDKMSMGASIESRVPLLDNQVIDMANTIPFAMKVKHLTPKYLLRNVANSFLPKNYLQRRKSGFGVPYGKWLNGDHGRKYIDMLRDGENKFDGINQRKIDRICNEHVQGVANHEDCLWPLVNYVLWRNIFIKGRVSA